MSWGEFIFFYMKLHLQNRTGLSSFVVGREVCNQLCPWQLIKKVGSVEKNNYSIDKNCLIIRTECGEYRFKINGDTGLANAQRIADVVVSEMKKVEKKFNTASKKSTSYTKLLLSNLNISDRFIQLEHKIMLII